VITPFSRRESIAFSTSSLVTPAPAPNAAFVSGQELSIGDQKRTGAQGTFHLSGKICRLEFLPVSNSGMRVLQSVLYFSLGNFIVFLATRWAGAVNFCEANLYFYLCRQRFRGEEISCPVSPVFCVITPGVW
jgi:hypothetical protein